VHRRMLVSAVLAALAPVLIRTGALAQRASAQVPYAMVDGSVGISLRETPLTFNVADVIPASLRLSVPLNYGIEPWVAGAVAPVRNVPCDSAGLGCANTERRVLLGVMYQSFGRGAGRSGGPYLGVGLGVRQFRGQKDFAHSIVLGLPFDTGSPISPSLELRSESYRGFGNELLIVSIGFRAGIGG